MSSVAQVGEIFSAAGTAFSKLAELTTLLQVDENAGTPIPGEKWDSDDLDMLKGAVKRFGDDLCRLTDRIKEKNNSVVKQDVKKHTYEATGVTFNSTNNNIQAGGGSSSVGRNSNATLVVTNCAATTSTPVAQGVATS